MTALLFLCLLSPLLVASQDPPATPLKCQQGPEGSEVSDCASGLDACMAIKDESTMFGPMFSTKFYTCGKSGSCANAFSITIEDGRHLRFSSACCSGDGCNKNLDWGVSPSTWTKNGFTCPVGCYAQTEDRCKDGTISCTDGQTSCIRATGSSGAKTFILKGCGTSNMCGVKDYEVIIGGIAYKMDEISCENATQPAT